jgi:cell surface protein SprA
MDVGDSYISDVLETSVKTENGSQRNIKWYQFRVPVYQPDKVIGGIQDFKSIRFVRMNLQTLINQLFAGLQLLI